MLPSKLCGHPKVARLLCKLGSWPQHCTMACLEFSPAEAGRGSIMPSCFLSGCIWRCGMPLKKANACSAQPAHKLCYHAKQQEASLLEKHEGKKLEPRQPWKLKLVQVKLVKHGKLLS